MKTYLTLRVPRIIQTISPNGLAPHPYKYGRAGVEYEGWIQMRVRSGDKVQVHYEGSLEDGRVFDSSEGREPLAFEVGAGQVIEGFEEGVMGMEKGEKKELSLPPAKAYGPHRDDLVGKLPTNQLGDLEPGSDIQIRTEEGEVVTAKVLQVAEDGVVFDINHPLAGQTLNFNVTLVGLEREG